LIESESSDTTIEQTTPKNNPVAYLSENSQYSGVIHLTSEKSVFAAASFSSYPMPKQGSPVLMELDYKTNNYFTVGLLVWEFGSLDKIPLLIINHSSDWNKIYINLGPNLSLHSQASDFQVYYEAGLDYTSSTADIYLDNIKLIYR
jgi:hypothetical protein